MIWYEDYIKEDMFLPQLEIIKKKKLCDNIICFDIETCNYFVRNNTAYSINDILSLCNNDIKRIDDFFDKSSAGSVPYIWQFCIDGRNVYGRELPDMLKLLKYIIKKTKGYQAHIWVHNLSFEYSFIQELIKFDTVFFTEARKPLYAKYKNVTFRCSYRLTSLSLAKWGEKLKIPKKVGQLDYHDMFSPKTELDEKALEYCEYDVIIMYFGILKQYLPLYKHIAYIPLTQTGMPRKELKQENAKIRGWCGKVAKMQPRTPEEWKIQNKCFSGGLTLSNPVNCNKVLEGVGSIDKKSAYPFCFLMKFPCTPFEKSPAPPIWDDGNHHICLVEFKNLRARYNITPLASSKRIMAEGMILSQDGKQEEKAILKNNGKVIFAKRFALYICEQDYLCMIKDFYTWDGDMIIHSHWIALSDYMPPHVVRYMLKRYESKSLLTGIDEDLRNIEKGKLNALYGLSATALVRDQITEDENYIYHKTRLNDAQIQAELDRYKKNTFRNVLPYSYAIYITSYQRRFLLEMMLKFSTNEGKKTDLDKICYTDTDSLKGFFTEEDFKMVVRENERIIDWTKERLKLQDIPYEMSCPQAPDGKYEYLGIWENDANYYRIKILRAKAYAYQYDPEDSTHITLAGVPKAAANTLKNPADLKDGLYFDIFNSRKNLLTYLDGNNPRIVLPDGYKVKNKCGCNIRPTSYKISLTDDYRDLLKKYLAQKYH